METSTKYREEVGCLLAVNTRDGATEEVLRLRALQELSLLDSDLLIELAYVVGKLVEDGLFDKHLHLYSEHVVGPRRQSAAPMQRAS